MSDFQILTMVRGHLLSKKVAERVHLALPPNALYPLILIELEEMWSSYPLQGDGMQNHKQMRVKFKVSVYSRCPGMEEATQISHKVRQTLEGETLRIPRAIEGGGDKLSTFRFLACVNETSGNVQGREAIHVIHHFYDSIVRG